MISKIRVEDRSLYARPDGGRMSRWAVCFERDGAAKRLRQTFATRREAQEAARALRERHCPHVEPDDPALDVQRPNGTTPRDDL